MLKDWLRQYLKEPIKSRNLKFHGHQFKSSYLDLFQRLSFFSIFLLLGFTLSSQLSSVQLEYDVYGFEKYFVKGILHYHQGNAIFFVKDTLSEDGRSYAKANNKPEIKVDPLTPQDVARGANVGHINVKINRVPKVGEIPILVQTDISKGERLSIKKYSSLDKSFVLKEKTGTIKWQLKPENRKIGGFNCQKAVGDFGGRTYTVWFSTEIPINVGPWKLDGLPGVLVAGKEDSDRVGFSLNDIQYDQDRPDMPDLNFSVEDTITCEESFRLSEENLNLKIKRLRSLVPREVTVGDADQVKRNYIQLECE